MEGAAPDLGSLRDDLLNLVFRMRAAMYSQGGCALRNVPDERDHRSAQPFIGPIRQGIVEPGCG